MKRDIVSIIALCLLAACKTVEPEVRTVEKARIEYRDRIVTVESPADSANIEALLRCDENGNVLVTSLQQESSRNASLSFQIDSLNRLIASFSTGPVDIPVEVHDTTYIHEERETESPEVEKKEGWFHRLIMALGTTSFIVIMAVSLYAFAPLFRRGKDSLVTIIRKIFGI